VNWVIG